MEDAETVHQVFSDSQVDFSHVGSDGVMMLSMFATLLENHGLSRPEHLDAQLELAKERLPSPPHYKSPLRDFKSRNFSANLTKHVQQNQILYFNQLMHA
jgi:hypothetical protein